MWGKVSNLIQIFGIAAYVKKITAVPAVAAAGAAVADAADAAGEGMDNAGDVLAQQFMILSGVVCWHFYAQVCVSLHASLHCMHLSACAY
jgi:hypothetical protein